MHMSTPTQPQGTCNSKPSVIAKYQLPHPRHITKIYSKINSDPGFTNAAFKALSSKARQNKEKGKDTLVAVMCDEMGI